MKAKCLLLCVLLGVGYSCSKPPVPKDRGFFRISFPKKKYKKLVYRDFYSFQMPVYAHFEEERQDADIWQNIIFPKYKGQLHLTYFKLKNNLSQHLEDTHKFVYKHTIKADAIKQQPYTNPSRRVYGVLYDIEGNTASSVQFFATDSLEHFLRGSLYLNEHPNKDSLAVVIDFLRQDVIELMETLEWR